MGDMRQFNNARQAGDTSGSCKRDLLELFINHGEGEGRHRVEDDVDGTEEALGKDEGHRSSGADGVGVRLFHTLLEEMAGKLHEVALHRGSEHVVNPLVHSKRSASKGRLERLCAVSELLGIPGATHGTAVLQKSRVSFGVALGGAPPCRKVHKELFRQADAWAKVLCPELVTEPRCQLAGVHHNADLTVSVSHQTPHVQVGRADYQCRVCDEELGVNVDLLRDNAASQEGVVGQRVAGEKVCCTLVVPSGEGVDLGLDVFDRLQLPGTLSADDPTRHLRNASKTKSDKG